MATHEVDTFLLPTKGSGNRLRMSAQLTQGHMARRILSRIRQCSPSQACWAIVPATKPTCPWFLGLMWGMWVSCDGCFLAWRPGFGLSQLGLQNWLFHVPTVGPTQLVSPL